GVVERQERCLDQHFLRRRAWHRFGGTCRHAKQEGHRNRTGQRARMAAPGLSVEVVGHGRVIPGWPALSGVSGTVAAMALTRWGIPHRRTRWSWRHRASRTGHFENQIAICRENQSIAQDRETAPRRSPSIAWAALALTQPLPGFGVSPEGCSP